MSDQMPNHQIEDVLSSIRRLVTEGEQPAAAQNAGTAVPDAKPKDAPTRLVLTPSLRVSYPDPQADTSEDAPHETAQEKPQETPQGNPGAAPAQEAVADPHGDGDTVSGAATVAAAMARSVDDVTAFAAASAAFIPGRAAQAPSDPDHVDPEHGDSDHGAPDHIDPDCGAPDHAGVDHEVTAEAAKPTISPATTGALSEAAAGTALVDTGEVIPTDSPSAQALDQGDRTGDTMDLTELAASAAATGAASAIDRLVGVEPDAQADPVATKRAIDDLLDRDAASLSDLPTKDDRVADGFADVDWTDMPEAGDAPDMTGHSDAPQDASVAAAHPHGRVYVRRPGYVPSDDAAPSDPLHETPGDDASVGYAAESGDDSAPQVGIDSAGLHAPETGHETDTDYETDTDHKPGTDYDAETGYEPDYGDDLIEETGTEPKVDEELGAFLSDDAILSDAGLDEETLRALIGDVIREELQGVMGERITRNLRKLVRREIHRVLSAQDYD